MDSFNIQREVYNQTDRVRQSSLLRVSRPTLPSKPARTNSQIIAFNLFSTRQLCYRMRHISKAILLYAYLFRHNPSCYAVDCSRRDARQTVRECAKTNKRHNRTILLANKVMNCARALNNPQLQQRFMFVSMMRWALLTTLNPQSGFITAPFLATCTFSHSFFLTTGRTINYSILINVLPLIGRTCATSHKQKLR